MRCLFVPSPARDWPELRQALIGEQLAVEMFDGEPHALTQLHEYDAAILDGRHSLDRTVEWVRHFRMSGHRLSIVCLLTHSRPPEHDVLLLDHGADNCFGETAPAAVIAAQLRAIGRRCTASSMGTLKYQDLVLDLGQRSAHLDGQALNLTQRQFDLVLYLVRNAETVCTRDQILRSVWGDNYIVGSNVVDVFVRQIRQKLGNNAKVGIRAISGVGYLLCRATNETAARP